MNEILSYHELIKLPYFGDRLEYLSLWNKMPNSPRTMSNPFYKSRSWIETRKLVIQRDLGYDLAIPGMFIDGPIFVHHIMPLSEEDINNAFEKLYDLDNLITVSEQTHNRIHYKEQLPIPERMPGDTKLW